MPRRTYNKFSRNDEPAAITISDRDLDLLRVILRYRFSPTSELVRLVEGNQRVTCDRLLKLYKAHLVNRWAFPGIPPSEFFYYLDNRAALDILADRRGLNVVPPMLDELKAHREKDYAQAAARGQHMQLGFLRHSLMLSRLHFMLELACKKSAGKIALEQWRQGGELAGYKVAVKKIQARRGAGNEYLWQENDFETERLPVEPDALFTLRFTERPAEQQLVHFLYEADRGTMTSTDLMKKLRAYWYLIKKQQRHQEAFGIHPVRAVLIETTAEARGQQLMDLVGHPLVAGPAKRAGLFWFTISPLFTGFEDGRAAGVARYLDRPEIVLKDIWALPDRTMHSLADAENAPLPKAAQA